MGSSVRKDNDGHYDSIDDVVVDDEGDNGIITGGGGGGGGNGGGGGANASLVFNVIDDLWKSVYNLSNLKGRFSDNVRNGGFDDHDETGRYNENYENKDGVGAGDITPTMPVYVHVLMYVAYVSIMVLGIGGNGIVCYIVFAYQKMRSVTNFFIVNLAVGDILMAGLCVPFTFVANLILFYWPFGAILCPIVTYAQVVSVFISAYTMVAISIDRYIAIIYPLRPRMTKLQAKLCILFVWMVALVTPLPTVIKSRLHQPDNWKSQEYYVCTEVWDTKFQEYFYSWLLTVLQYVVPLAALIFTYARIAVVVWGKRAPGEAEDSRDQRLKASKRKMIKMMITVVFIFTLCWLPFNTLILIGLQDNSIWSLPSALYIWFGLHWLAMSHTCCNPIIYCWMNARFRDGFRRVFRHFVSAVCRLCPLCRRRQGHVLGGRFSGGCGGPGRSGGGGGGGGKKYNQRQKDDHLRRCNTYTTSYSSVRTTSIRAGHTGQGQARSLLVCITSDATENDNPLGTTGIGGACGHQNHNHGHSDGFVGERSEMLNLRGRSSAGQNNREHSGYEEDLTTETNI